MTKSKRWTAMPVVVVAVGLVLASCALAGDYHYGTSLNCNNCHVMHGSYNGTLYNGGNGSPNLLKGTVNQTCLSCHDGSSRDIVANTGTAAAPNDAIAVAHPSVYKNSSGFFQGDWASVASPVGHDLGPTDVTAIQGTWASTSDGMKCTDCHEAHGSPNWRNIKLRPGTAGANVVVEEGTQIHVKAGVSGWAQTMDTDSIAFNDPNRIVSWCIGCHTDITDGDKHPQNSSLGGGDVDGAHWVGGTGTGFGTGVGDGVAGIPRVRFAQAGADYVASSTPATTNRVFCLSCHKAHGSKYDSALVWPHYTTGDADQTSACGQCHNAGG